jgi:type IV secretion system protein VirB3
MNQVQLHKAKVFKALSRPAMIMGVDYDYFYLSSLLVMLVFVYSENIGALFLFAPMHLVGWILCKIDPFIFKLISARASIGILKNKNFWGAQSYEAI